MHNCKSCNYHTDKLSNFKKHLTTQKHLLNSNINTKVLICNKCNNTYKTNNSFNRHLIKCNNIKNENEIEIELLENIRLKKDLEILKLKNELIAKTNMLNSLNNNITNINKLLENYKNQYGLTSKQTEDLLSNYKNNGVIIFISSLIYHIKESEIQKCKELKGKELTND
jgi:septal ring factor EnvC (AmiA/AmiB activator)